MNYQLDTAGLKNFKTLLAGKLLKGCQIGAEELQSYTPVDTKRLYTSTRATNLVVNDKSITCKIRAGGENLQGVTRERDISRDVDYAVFVEVRTGYLTENLTGIVDALVRGITE